MEVWTTIGGLLSDNREDTYDREVLWSPGKVQERVRRDRYHEGNKVEVQSLSRYGSFTYFIVAEGKFQPTLTQSLLSLYRCTRQYNIHECIHCVVCIRIVHPRSLPIVLFVPQVPMSVVPTNGFMDH